MKLQVIFINFAAIFDDEFYDLAANLLMILQLMLPFLEVLRSEDY